MEAKFVNESITEKSSRSNIEELIQKNIRTKKTRAKLLGYIDQIFSFSEDNRTISDKKDLTRINNELNSFCSQCFKIEDEIQFKADLLKIAQEKGYESVYAATDGGWGEVKKPTDKFLKTFQFPAVYGAYDAARKVNAIEGLKLSRNELVFVYEYFLNIYDWAYVNYKLEEIRKIIAPTAEEKRGKAAEIIKGKVNPQIKSAIDEIGENFRKDIEANENRWYRRKFERFVELFPEGATYEDYHNKRYRDLFTHLSGFIKQNHTYTKFNLDSDCEAKAARLAKTKSEMIILGWKVKMYDKLGGFISDLNKPFTLSVRGSQERQNDISFKFEDGSSFTLRNNIVDKVSHLGTFFYTYPTTFHNAYLPDGSKIANPNEVTVKKAFNSYNA